MSAQDTYKSTLEHQGFAKAYSTYNRYRKTLKRIYNETLNLYTSNCYGVKTNLDLDHLKLTPNEASLLQNTISSLLSIVVIGQTYKSKCLFINKLLGLDLLPTASENWVRQSRMTKFKYGSRPQVSISTQDSCVIIEPRLHSSTSTESVNWDQEFKLLENDLEKVEGGVVEITLHHPVLRGSQVILTSGNEALSDVTLPNSSSSLLTSQCTTGLMPIFVYAFKQEALSAKEMKNLAELRAQYQDSAIAFWFHGYTRNVSEEENLPPLQENFSDVPMSKQADSLSVCRKERMTLSSSENAKCSKYDENNVLSADKTLGVFERADVCNNQMDETGKTLGSKDSCECEKMKTKKKMYPSEPNRLTERLQRNLYDVGFSFTQSHGGTRHPPSKYLIDSGASSLDSSAEESFCPEICTQTNPSYVSFDLRLVEDRRFRNFPPCCVLITQQDRLYSKLLPFVRNFAKYYLARAAKILHILHTTILDSSIRYAFQMSRDLMITPKRVDYVKQQEKQLYAQLVTISTKKQEEIQVLISGIKTSLREIILTSAENYQIQEGEGTFRQVSIVKSEIQDQVLHQIKTETAERLYRSIQVLKESYVGTLSRCLENLESSVEKNFEGDEEGKTSKHFKKLLHAAYGVELNIQSSSSLARIMIDKLRQLLSNLPWHEPPIMDKVWKRNIAADVLSSLDDSRLAKSICSQLRTRLCQSHAAFLASLRQLELTHLCRLEHMEDNRHKVAKVIAPHIARLALESTSMIDSVMYGMPRMGREIGRGMYGVVYQCDSWSSWSPCAVKSVAPPDEKHANDLSLEFYYTQSLPEHPRIAQIRGSVVDETYAGGMGPPAVLLVMDRMHCDLHTSIKKGLKECERMQVAVDVVEGIRFLHSQGLIHRDIKLKNVLLDRRNRAKITDLGFCKPGAMISGSIVGTPVHMPPELFTGKYDSSVDVYAFGILFWYICAGITRLPKNFENCTTKDHLWTAVRKGLRPERLPVFSDECWYLMKACWHSDPMRRPLLGKIHPKLVDIHSRLKKRCSN